MCRFYLGTKHSAGAFRGLRVFDSCIVNCFVFVFQFTCSLPETRSNFGDREVHIKCMKKKEGHRGPVEDIPLKEFNPVRYFVLRKSKLKFLFAI